MINNTFLASQALLIPRQLDIHSAEGCRSIFFSCEYYCQNTQKAAPHRSGRACKHAQLPGPQELQMLSAHSGEAHCLQSGSVPDRACMKALACWLENWGLRNSGSVDMLENRSGMQSGLWHWRIGADYLSRQDWYGSGLQQFKMRGTFASKQALLCRFPGNDPAPNLDPKMPGYYGFDPLTFIQDEESKNWYQQAELVHSRICMTSAAGILFPAVSFGFSTLYIAPPPSVRLNKRKVIWQ